MACFSANFFLIRNAIDLRGAGCLQKLTGGYGVWEHGTMHIGNFRKDS